MDKYKLAEMTLNRKSVFEFLCINNCFLQCDIGVIVISFLPPCGDILIFSALLEPKVVGRGIRDIIFYDPWRPAGRPLSLSTTQIKFEDNFEEIIFGSFFNGGSQYVGFQDDSNLFLHKRDDDRDLFRLNFQDFYQVYYNSIVGKPAGVIRVALQDLHYEMLEYGSTFELKIGDFRYFNGWRTTPTLTNIFWTEIIKTKNSDENTHYIKIYEGIHVNFMCFFPVLHDDVMYFGSYQNELLCQKIDPTTGGPIRKSFSSKFKIATRNVKIVSFSKLNGEFFILLQDLDSTTFQIHRVDLHKNSFDYVCDQNNISELTCHIQPRSIVAPF